MKQNGKERVQSISKHARNNEHFPLCSDSPVCTVENRFVYPDGHYWSPTIKQDPQMDLDGSPTVKLLTWSIWETTHPTPSFQVMVWEATANWKSLQCHISMSFFLKDLYPWLIVAMTTLPTTLPFSNTRAVSLVFKGPANRPAVSVHLFLFLHWQIYQVAL